MRSKAELLIKGLGYVAFTLFWMLFFYVWSAL
jgi:hypothetical protein